jgi:hypothetical protein
MPKMQTIAPKTLLKLALAIVKQNQLTQLVASLLK